MSSYHDQLQFQALQDLTNRSKSGIPMYICVWLMITLIYDIQNTHPSFFIINLSTFSTLVALRLAHLRCMSVAYQYKSATLMQWFVGNLLLCAVHWGLMTAWVIHDPTLQEVELLFLIITPAFALGGASTLSISSEIKVLYPTLMFFPLILTLLSLGGLQEYLLATMCGLALIYIFISTSASHKDYWEAITNYMVAEERAEQMEKLSVTDPLTKLHNRMYFDSEYAKEWKRSLRLKAPLSIIMIDIDFFKNINDTYGHIFGDDCLKVIAQTLAKEAKRPTDRVARYGGEEFVMLLPNTNAEGTKTIANRIRKAVEDISVDFEGETVKMTISIGGATAIPEIKDDRSSLLRRSDSALYLAKENGRNQYQAETTGLC